MFIEERIAKLERQVTTLVELVSTAEEGIAKLERQVAALTELVSTMVEKSAMERPDFPIDKFRSLVHKAREDK